MKELKEFVAYLAVMLLYTIAAVLILYITRH
jgi:hypothetical protein